MDRVFLLPCCLQCYLFYTPALKFWVTGPKIKLMFGKSADKPYLKPLQVWELFGCAVHHASRARFCIERGWYWQAEYWISAIRHYALHLACLRRDLPASQGGGFDDFPPEIHQVFNRTFVGSLTRDELIRTLNRVIDGPCMKQIKSRNFHSMLSHNCSS